MSVENVRSSGTVRLVVLSQIPEEYPPQARCITITDGMDYEKAISLAREFQARLPSMANMVFLEDISAPATRKDMSCKECNERRLFGFNLSLISDLVSIE